MGFYGYLEIRAKNTLPILHDDELNVGNTLAVFLNAYENYILKGNKSPFYIWFVKLEGKRKKTLRVLAEIIYAGEGNISSEELDEYVANWQEGDPISIDELKYMTNIENKWKNLDEVIKAVADIIHLFIEIKQDTYWYSIVDTPQAFNALLDTLKEAKRQGGRQVRIQFL